MRFERAVVGEVEAALKLSASVHKFTNVFGCPVRRRQAGRSRDGRRAFGANGPGRGE